MYDNRGRYLCCMDFTLRGARWVFDRFSPTFYDILHIVCDVAHNLTGDTNQSSKDYHNLFIQSAMT